MAIMSWLFLKFSDDFQFESNLGQSGRKNQFVIKKIPNFDFRGCFNRACSRSNV